jgi:hypothetical protein
MILDKTNCGKQLGIINMDVTLCLLNTYTSSRRHLGGGETLGYRRYEMFGFARGRFCSHVFRDGVFF